MITLTAMYSIQNLQPGKDETAINHPKGTSIITGSKASSYEEKILTSTIGSPKHNHYYEIGENTDEWLTGIGSQTPIWINASQTCPPIKTLIIALYVTDQYGDWEIYQTITITDNSVKDSNLKTGHITYHFNLNESYIYQIHYWAIDSMGNHIPDDTKSYREVECIVDGINPHSQVSYNGPYHHNTKHWMTSKTFKIITSSDTGFKPEGSGVKKIDWWIEEKISDQWIVINESTVYDNDCNDTDGSPAHPIDETGGIYALDQVGWPYYFKDNGDTAWTYDVNDTILSKDPDGDNQDAVPKFGQHGGLFSFDLYREPFLFKDMNNNWKLDQDEKLDQDDVYYPEWLDLDEDNILANQTLNTKGGLFSFDNANQPYTFTDDNNNWQYNTGELLDVNPYNDGPLNTITMKLNISSDGTYRIYHQSVDYLGNKEPIQKQLVKIDNTPPTTNAHIGQPNHTYFSNEDDENWYGVTTDTPITLQSTDLLHQPAVGIENLHYEIRLDSNNDNTFDELITSVDDLWANSTFTFTEECKHQLRYYAIDKLGNIEKEQTINFTVDDQKPEIQITVNNPFVEGSGEPNYWVTSKTNITINATQHGCCPCLKVKYRLNDDKWENITDHLPFVIQLPEEKRYELEVKATDYLQTKIDEMVFYTDNTPPELHILDPVNSEWFSDESDITTVTYAVDVPNQNPHCDAVGIPENSHPKAYLIDVFPTFNIIELSTNNCYYDSASHEYIGHVHIPENTNIPDGMVLFVFEATDALGNGINNMVELLEFYYQNANGDTDSFNQSIQSYLDLEKLIRLGIDNTAPDISILQPNINQVVGPESVTVSAVISDALAGIENLAPCHIYFYGETYYLGSLPFSDGTIEGSLSFPSNLVLEETDDLPLMLTIADRAGNIATNSILVTYENPYVTPQVSIAAPDDNHIITDDAVTVKINVESNTNPQELDVYLLEKRDNYPELRHEALFNSSSSTFDVLLTVSEYKNNSEITVQAEAIDTDETGVSSPVTYTIRNSIIYEAYLDMNNDGWNPLSLSSLNNYSDPCAVDEVFASVLNNVSLILEQGTWKNFIPGEGGNTLTVIDSTKTYWVKMKQADRLYIDENHLPC